MAGELINMERLDKHLMTLYPDFSRSRIEGLVKAGFVTVNGVAAVKSGQKVASDAKIEVYIPPPVPAEPEPEEIPLDIIFEDDDIIVINKEAGMVVHPAPGHFTGTLVNALLAHCPNLGGIGGVARPGIVHRLDRDTSGLIVVAKSQKAMDGLVKTFSSRERVRKTYIAICHGKTNQLSGRIDNNIGRHPVDRKRMAVLERGGKQAITVWKYLSPLCDGACSAVECVIETGRTHQIRVHMSHMGHPIIGDEVYGKKVLDKRLKNVPLRQMLHAWKLMLPHPVTREMLNFEAPIPGDMSVFLEGAKLNDNQTGEKI
jgi:23S rRNA pseudouridine1911/1915/1917 synthase